MPLCAKEGKGLQFLAFSFISYTFWLEMIELTQCLVQMIKILYQKKAFKKLVLII